MPLMRSAPTKTEKVDVRLRDSPDPARTAADLRAGRIDVMWAVRCASC